VVRRLKRFRLWAFKLTIEHHDYCLDEVNRLVVPMVDRAGARGVKEVINLYQGTLDHVDELQDELRRTQLVLAGSEKALADMTDLARRQERTLQETARRDFERHALDVDQPIPTDPKLSILGDALIKEMGADLPVTQMSPIYSEKDEKL
jgi:hypothetical protein